MPSRWVMWEIILFLSIIVNLFSILYYNHYRRVKLFLLTDSCCFYWIEYILCEIIHLPLHWYVIYSRIFFKVLEETVGSISSQLKYTFLVYLLVINTCKYKYSCTKTSSSQYFFIKDLHRLYKNNQQKYYPSAY